MATEIEKVKTLAGELDKSISDIDEHAQDGLDFGHSKIYGKIEAFQGFDDLTANPSLTTTNLYKRLYGQYRLIRRLYASAYLLKSLGRHIAKAQAQEKSANELLLILEKDYSNFQLTESEGEEGGSGSIATVSTSPKTFPANLEGEIFKSPTMRRGFLFPS